MNLTLFIIIITAAVSILSFNNRQMFDNLKFNPYMISKRKDNKRWFTHALVHADWMHLIVNMFVLYSFGDVVEHIMSREDFFPKTYFLGNFLYILMYVAAIIISSLPAFYKHKNSHSYNAVGASGAVSAVVFASILLYPEMKLGLIIIPFVKIPGPIFGILYLVYSYYMSKKSNDNIGHEAHFAGSVFGFIFPILINPELIKDFFSSIF